MKNIFYIIFSLLILNGCKTIEKPLYIHGSYKTEKSISSNQVNSKVYKLKKYQDYEFEEKFRSIVESSYIKTQSKYNSNFLYKINPQGAVYSFSDVEIVCIVSSKVFQSVASEICNDFFKNLDMEYEKMKGEIK